MVSYLDAPVAEGFSTETEESFSIRARAKQQSAPGGFPTTRYFGSKRRQIDWLKQELTPLRRGAALDAFGGTGAVSHLLSQMGWSTTYNDVFRFNTISATALFSDSTQRLSENELRDLLSRVMPKQGFIATEFDELYFTAAENQWLDGYMELLQTQPKEHKALLLHCLFQACLKKRPYNLFHRLNLDIRRSTVAVSFGNRTTWETPFDKHILSTYREVKRMQMLKQAVSVGASQSINHVRGKFDLVYLDPPYFSGKKKTESYLERYHFLEGLARYDEWPQLIDRSSRLKMLNPSSSIEWGKADVLPGVEQLIRQHATAQFALSYVSGEAPSDFELLDLFHSSFDHVRYTRRQVGRTLSKKSFFEILLIGY